MVINMYTLEFRMPIIVTFSAIMRLSRDQPVDSGGGNHWKLSHILRPGLEHSFLVLYNWLIWRVLKLAFFFQKSIFPVFILASVAVRTTPSLSTYFYAIFNLAVMRAFAKKRQIKNHAKLTSYTVYREAERNHMMRVLME